MRLEIKIIFKILTYFLVAGLLMFFLTVIFGFPIWLFRPPVVEYIEKISLYGLLPLNTFTAYLGYRLAGRMNKDKILWGLLSFIFSIWGPIYLYLLSRELKKQQGLG